MRAVCNQFGPSNIVQISFWTECKIACCCCDYFGAKCKFAFFWIQSRIQETVCPFKNLRSPAQEWHERDWSQLLDFVYPASESNLDCGSDITLLSLSFPRASAANVRSSMFPLPVCRLTLYSLTVFKIEVWSR